MQNCPSDTVTFELIILSKSTPKYGDKKLKIDKVLWPMTIQTENKSVSSPKLMLAYLIKLVSF